MYGENLICEVVQPDDACMVSVPYVRWYLPDETCMMSVSFVRSKSVMTHEW